MAENLELATGTKTEKYATLIPQVKSLLTGEPNLMANLANAASALKMTFDFFWVGFYLVDSSDELVLGPFQGPIACTRIRKGKGVCGASWENDCVYLVPNVEEFPGHIACSSESKSEIVIPIRNNKNEFVALLDVDSDKLNDFDQADELALTDICTWIGLNCF